MSWGVYKQKSDGTQIHMFDCGNEREAIELAELANEEFQCEDSSDDTLGQNDEQS